VNDVEKVDNFLLYVCVDLLVICFVIWCLLAVNGQDVFQYFEPFSNSMFCT